MRLLEATRRVWPRRARRSANRALAMHCTVPAHDTHTPAIFFFGALPLIRHLPPLSPVNKLVRVLITIPNCNFLPPEIEARLPVSTVAECRRSFGDRPQTTSPSRSLASISRVYSAPSLEPISSIRRAAPRRWTASSTSILNALNTPPLSRHGSAGEARRGEARRGLSAAGFS